MSLEQFQESFQIGVFYSCHHYYHPSSTLPAPQGSVKKLLANIAIYFAWLMSA